MTSPMQISPATAPTITAATATNTTPAVLNSLPISARHSVPPRSSQGVQRSASSYDAENRSGPIKRLKATLSAESSSPSTAVAIATVKKHPVPARRPLTAIPTPPRPTQSKPTTPIKLRTSPMEASPARPQRLASITNTAPLSSAPSRSSLDGSTKLTGQASFTQETNHVSLPLPPRPATFPRKQRLSIFGEQFSDDILKVNLLWISINELDEDGRKEVLIQFGSMEHFLREQDLFTMRQKQQFKLAAQNKAGVSRSRFQLSAPKKDRLELL